MAAKLGIQKFLLFQVDQTYLVGPGPGRKFLIYAAGAQCVRELIILVSFRVSIYSSYFFYSNNEYFRPFIRIFK
jgi:hypothetical protein